MAETAETTEPLFADTAVMALAIEAPFSEIFDERESDEYHPGVLTYTEADGSSRTLDVGLQARGIFRRQRENCDFPPLRINFRKKQLDDTLFAGQDKIKLVTHCAAREKSPAQLVLKEYLAYRIFNQLTERSFRVRLLDIQYNEAGKRKSISSTAFFIEDKEAMARRNGATLQELARIRPRELERVHTSLVEVFQYLIGNTDFSMTTGPEGACCHNVVPIAATPGSYYIVPYDFDFAGLVSSPYAAPSDKLDIRDVRQRLYRGTCLSNDYLPGTLAHFNQVRGAIEGLLQDVPGLTDRTRRKTRDYVAKFYETINDPSKMTRKLLDKCR